METPEEQARNELRMQIARVRRRLDARIRSAAGRTTGMVSLPRLFGRYPRIAMLIGLWAGRAVLGTLREDPKRWLGQPLLRQVAGKAAEGFWRKFRQYRAERRAKRAGQKHDGGEHG
jgi:hypothetical protein